MSQAGFTPIQLYFSTTAAATPSAGNLANGELALNITDGKLFYKDNGGVVQTLATKSSAISPVTNNGVVYVNGSGQATTGSALTFDGTNLGVGTSSPSAKLHANIGTSSTGAGNPGAWDATYAVFGGTGATASAVGIGFNGGGTLTAITPSSSWQPMTYLAQSHAFKVSGTQAMTLDPSENLGLGVAPSAWSTSGNMQLPTLTLAGHDFSIGANYYQSGGSRYITTAPSSRLSFFNGSFQFIQAPSGTAGTVMSSTQAMTLTSGGILLVGGTSVPLTAGARIAALSSGDTAIQLTKDGVVAGRVMAVSTGLAFGVDGADGATERARITSNGNFGLGTIPAAPSGQNRFFAIGDTDTGMGWVSDGILTLCTNNAEVLRCDNNSNVGIGTTSVPSNARLRVRNSDARSIQFESQGSTHQKIVFINDNGTTTRGQVQCTDWLVSTSSNDSSYFINTAGAHFINTDSNQTINGSAAGTLNMLVAGDVFNIKQTADASNAINVWQTGSSEFAALAFYKGNSQTQVGSITVNTSSTAYNTTSDYRVKNNIRPMVGGLDRVLAMKPSLFTMVNDGSESEGFIAHELQEVAPVAVTGEKDAVYKDGTPKIQGVDYGRITPILVSALQEAHSLIKDQAAAIQTLTARVAALESN